MISHISTCNTYLLLRIWKHMFKRGMLLYIFFSFEKLKDTHLLFVHIRNLFYTIEELILKSVNTIFTSRTMEVVHKTTSSQLDQIFSDGCKEIFFIDRLLRNKDSFASQALNKSLMNSYNGHSLKVEACMSTIKIILLKLKAWVVTVLEIRSGKHIICRNHQEASDYQSWYKDIFDKDYSDFEGEEFELDNLLI